MINHNLPIVAVVGPPNAGKSTLINKIAGKPLAVTSTVAGTTRDRQYINTLWNGAAFTLVDTAGLDHSPQGELEKNVIKQIDVAIEEADVLILTLDGKLAARQLPETVLKKFRNLKKPILLAINKLDSPKIHDEKLGEFQALGIKKVFPISSVSGLGMGDMLDAIVSVLPKKEEQEVSAQVGIAVSIVGKPNVGKSSLFNSILKQERTVVSAVAGTTRTAIDENIIIDGTEYTFIDTAGLKKKAYRAEQPDVFGGFQTFKAIRRSDVCFFVIDAAGEITKQDQIIASEIFNMEKGCIILANKIDLVPGSIEGKDKGGVKRADDSYKSVRDYISHHFPFLWMCPLIFVSAVSGKGLDEAISALKPIYDRRHKLADEQSLNDFLQKLLKKNPPKLLRDQRKPKVFSLRQTDVNPPAFELFVNYPAAISTQFRKFVENSIIKYLDFWGTPIILRLRGKDKK